MELFWFFFWGGGVQGCGASRGWRRCSATSVQCFALLYCCNALHCIDFFGKRMMNLEIVYISGQNLLKM